MVLSEGTTEKIPGIDPRTLRLVAQRLNHYATPGPTNRNEYQKYILGIRQPISLGLTILPPSYADCLKVWDPQLAGTLRACPGPNRDYFTFSDP